jgi:hypothetical protein
MPCDHGTEFRTASLSGYLKRLLDEYEWHISQSGAGRRPLQRPPDASLSNDMLPMLKDRWATGPYQHTPEITRALDQAFRLVSLFLTNDHCLLWFSHLTFGKRRGDRSAIERQYIVPTAYSTSPAAIAKVKENLHKLGRVITFMFHPPGSEDKNWGVTYHSKTGLECYNQFRASDWPSTNNRHHSAGKLRPLVTMNLDFQDFFLRVTSTSSRTEWYRASFIFAATLTHEIAHAYNFWLVGEHDGGEPRWCRKERNAELGWSWEANIIGFCLQNEQTNSSEKFGMLISQKVEAWSTMTERTELYKRLVGSNRSDSHFTKVDVSGRACHPPLLKADTLMGSSLLIDDPHDGSINFIAALQTIPIQWITDWFQDDQWAIWERTWIQKQRYVRRSLGNAFMILYERYDGNQARIMRPLNPDCGVDYDILRRRERGDHSR